MATHATEAARQELAELRKLIDETRRDLGITDAPADVHGDGARQEWVPHGMRRVRRARRRAPVA